MVTHAVVDPLKANCYSLANSYIYNHLMSISIGVEYKLIIFQSTYLHAGLISVLVFTSHIM